MTLTKASKIIFMELLYLDRMKEFIFYYPSGNYSRIIEKMEILFNKKAEQRGLEKNRFKRSVNKIM